MKVKKRTFYHDPLRPDTYRHCMTSETIIKDSPKGNERNRKSSLEDMQTVGGSYKNNDLASY